MPYSKAGKKAYMEHYRARRKAGKRPQRFGDYIVLRRASASSRTRKEFAGLSYGDAIEVRKKFFSKKKRKK